MSKYKTITWLLLAVLPFLCFSPSLVWWQIPLSVVGFILLQLLLFGSIFSAKIRPSVPIGVLILFSIASFYYGNWDTTFSKTDKVETISLSLNGSSADLQVFTDPDLVTIRSNQINKVAGEIITVNQVFGKVKIVKLEDSGGQVFSVAAIETDKLFSKIGWFKSKIFLRRITSILRQREEPLLVIIRSSLPAGSSLINAFMFQARLETRIPLNNWQSLVALNNTLVLARGIRFPSAALEGEGKLLHFAFKD